MPASIVLSAIYGSAAAASAALGSIGLAAATFAINFAVSYVVTRAFGSKPPQSQDTGARQQVPPASNNSIPVVYGDAWLGGTFVDAVLSTNQKTMYYVLAISSISSDASATFSFDRTKFYYGDRLVTFDGTDLTKVVSLTDGDGNVDTKISGNLYISLYTSTNAGVITAVNGNAPNVTMGGADIPAALRWPATGRQMNGLAFAIVKLNYNSDAGTTGLLPITFYCKHYPKGGAVAKPGDVWYDYMTDARYGAGMTGLVDSASATALNTYSDQTITYTPSGGGSATQARYRINGVVDTGKPVLDNVEKMLECCDSWMAYNAASGLWSVVINKAETSSFSFNDTNLIGEIRVSAVDINQQINQIQIEFPSKLNRDQPDLVYMETPAGLLYPNEPANRQTTTLEFTNDSVQAQYLGNRRLEQAREDLIVTITSTYPGIQVDAGDVVDITNADYGWTNKLFRVMKVSEATVDDGNLGATLELSEYNAVVYDDASITAFTAAPNSQLPSPGYISAANAPVVTNPQPTVQPPTFDVQCTIPAVGRCIRIGLYYTTVATPADSDWQLWGIASLINGESFVNSSTYTFTNVNLTPDTYYFAFLVGNDQTLVRSSTSSAFVWSPTAAVGPTGPTGSIGPTGGTGPTGNTPDEQRIIFLQQSQTLGYPATPSPTSGSTSVPAGWTAAMPTITIGETIWASYGTYVTSTNTTTWDTPVAFNVFQSILSDNYNGPIPPTPADFGTAGWYLDKTSGSLYANSAYLRGELVTGVSGAQRIEINKTAANKVAVYNSANQLLGYFGGTGATANYVMGLSPKAISGSANAAYFELPVANGSNDGTGLIVNDTLTGKISGTVGFYLGTLWFGVNGDAANSAATAVASGYMGYRSGTTHAAGRYINGTGGTEVRICDNNGYAINVVSGTIRYGSYTFSAFNGSTSQFLRGDGTFATPTGSTTSSITFNNGGAGGASGSTFNGSSALTVSYNTIGAAATNQTFYLGTTSIAINRASSYLVLDDVDITGNAGYANSAGEMDAGGLTSGTVPPARLASVPSGQIALFGVNGSGVGEFTRIVTSIITGDVNTGGGAIAQNLVMQFRCTISGQRFHGGTGSIDRVTLESSSDARLKQDIKPETYGLDFVNQLKPVTYRWKENPDLNFHGFIAQDVEPLIKGENDSLAQTHKDGTKAVDYVSLIGPLVKAVQELSAEVERLKGQLCGK
jgi:hypothetical protein